MKGHTSQASSGPALHIIYDACEELASIEDKSPLPSIIVAHR